MREHLTELERYAREAMERWNGDINRATCMLELILSKRIYLHKALIADYLARIQVERRNGLRIVPLKRDATPSP